MENETLEHVFPIENGDIPASRGYFTGSTFSIPPQKKQGGMSHVMSLLENCLQSKKSALKREPNFP